MPKTVFVRGQKLYEDWLNAIQNLNFLGLDVDGSYQPIPDEWLSSNSTALKSRFSAFADALKVTAGTGLVVNYAAGVATLLNNTTQTFAPGSLAVLNNTTSFVYVNESNAVVNGDTLPVRCLPLASVTTLAGAITNISDLRPRFRVLPRPDTLRYFGSGGYEGDLTISSNTTLNGRRYVRNFTVNAGVTVTVSGGFLEIFASGDVTINGTIIVTPSVAGGRGFTGNTGNGQYQADSGLGFGGAGGHNAASSPTYSFYASLLGSGGASGFVNLIAPYGSTSITSSKGGNGGGYFGVECAGKINITGTINCNGGNAVDGSILATTAGGGIVLTGGGGGSGGLIWLRSLGSLTVTAAATLQARGGNGASGVANNYSGSSAGGGGGGGGYIVFNSSSINTTGATIQVTGGTAGTQVGTPPGIGGSIGGSFGGQGGLQNANGSTGQIINQSFIPI